MEQDQDATHKTQDIRRGLAPHNTSPILSLLYPSKCALCGQLGPEPLCGACFSEFSSQQPRSYRTEPPLDYAAALFDYTGKAARAVQRLKYERVTSLAAWMGKQMNEGAAERALLDVDAIVPVPIHWSRLAQRGFNQAELLCEQLPGDRVRRDLLTRSRATRAQVGLSHLERAKNLEGAFTAKDLGDMQRVLLVDDVLTSGGTASECAGELKRKGAVEVGILCFAAEARWRNS